jgi:hypothetical protein
MKLVDEWKSKGFGDRVAFIIPFIICAVLLGMLFFVLYNAVVGFLALSFQAKMGVSGAIGIVVSWLTLCWVVPRK